MRPEIIDLLLCPVCGRHPLEREPFSWTGDGEIRDGVLWCFECGNWFPIDDELLELVNGPLAYAEDRAQFCRRREKRPRDLNLNFASREQEAPDDAEILSPTL